MILFLESYDDNMPNIIMIGPHIPYYNVTTEVNISPKGEEPRLREEVRTLVKPRTQWDDEDKKMANLDVRARNFIVQAMPTDIYKAIQNCSTAKKMWDTLITMFEGSSTAMESTKTTLTRKYERFFALKGESLIETHTRFNAIVNDLISIGINKPQTVLKSKFLDSLPPKWNSYVATVKLSPVYLELDLAGLFGLLLNHQNNEAEKMIAMGETMGSSTSALVADTREHHDFHSNDFTHGFGLSEKYVDAEEEFHENDYGDEGDVWANEIAMLAERMRGSYRGKFRGKGKGTSTGEKFKKPMDMSKVTCYRCGNTGHMSNDCKSKATKAEPNKSSGTSSKADKYSKLKNKYRKLKAQLAQESQKSLVAKGEGITESDTSSDEEVFEEAPKSFLAKEVCLMARESMQRFAQDMAKIQAESKSSALEASTSNKVSQYSNYSHSQLVEILNTLSKDLVILNKVQAEEKLFLKALKAELNSSKLKNEKLSSEINALKLCNSQLLTESKMFESKFKKSERMLNNWMENSTKVTNLVNSQIPNQVKAVIGENLDAAIAFSELSIVEPTYEPKEQTNPKIFKKITKPVKAKGGQPIFKKANVGFESECSTMSEFKNQIIKEVVDPSEPLQIGSSPSPTNQAEPITIGPPLSLTCQSKKPVTKTEKKNKTEKVKVPKNVKQVSKLNQSGDNKTIVKLVESRLNEISKEVDFLKSLSKVTFSKKSLTMSKTKLNDKLNVKKVVETEPIRVAQTEKQPIKQQWVPKQTKQVTQSVLIGELMCDLNSGEPISGWVPKLN